MRHAWLNNNALSRGTLTASANETASLGPIKGTGISLPFSSVVKLSIVVNNVSTKLLGHVVLVVWYHNSVKVLDSKWIDNKGTLRRFGAILRTPAVLPSGDQAS